MAEHNVIAITFPEPSTAFEALSRLKAAGFEGRVGVRAAAVVERDEQGRITAPERTGDGAGATVWGGGLVGLTVGILGGPVGMLFGWTTGMLIGGAIDVQRLQRGAGMLDEMSEAIPPGRNAVVAEVEEVAVEVVDGLAAELGGTVGRRSATEVLAELEAAEEAYEEAQRAASKAAREQRRADRKEDVEERKATLKRKLGMEVTSAAG